MASAGCFLADVEKKEDGPATPEPKKISPELQQRLDVLNAGLVVLRDLIGAAARSEVVAVRGAEQGQLLVFRDGTQVTLACDEAAAEAPLIGVAADGGTYYWTLASEKEAPRLSDGAGKPCLVADGVPVVGVDEAGYWTLTTGENSPWRMVDRSGRPVAASDWLQPVLFRSVAELSGRLEIRLADGGILSVLRVTDLSAGGTANCYVVTAPGRCLFNAKLRGNGVGDVATTGFDPRIEMTDGMKADWLWCDREGLVSEVELDPASGEILLTVGEGPGNAVVALLRDGAVVWSWHLWVTEAPQTVTYGNGMRFMDRNLGARGVRVGGTEAYGMYYQWGRKDPFYGGETTETSSTAFAEAKRLTVMNPEAAAEWKIDKRTVTAAEAAAMPTTFFSAKLASGTYDWLSNPNAGLWGLPRRSTIPVRRATRSPK